jgi:Ni/Co efflux regulator RcnB
MGRVPALVVAGLLVAVTLPAAGGDQGKPKGKKDKKADTSATVEVSVHFSTGQRRAVESYFVEHHGRGGCPPGLAKKNNGCLPPGQAKKRYSVGQPLPPGVETHPPAAEVRIRLGEPPEGFRYVMVDGDLVKLAVGTMLVVDAIGGLVD